MRQTKYCRVPIKQRLFSFNFTFQLSHYSILSFSPLLSSELDFVSRTNRKLFSFRSGYDGGLHSFTGVSSTWGFLRSFSGVSLWERLGGGYLHWFWAFLYSRLVFSKTEVIYVSFSLYCKTRLFSFGFANTSFSKELQLEWCDSHYLLWFRTAFPSPTCLGTLYCRAEIIYVSVCICL